MGKIKIKYKKTEELIEYKNNAKTHPPDQVEKIADSIREFGFKNPVIVQSNGIIIAGHGRLLAAQVLGLEDVPCIVADDLTEAQVMAYRIADNKTAESDWDFDKLELDIKDLDQMDIDLKLTGFDHDELMEMLGVEGEITGGLDEVPEMDETVEPIIQLGDVITLGGHRLVCGDSTDKDTVELLMGGKKADMVFTDPPYGINLDTDYSKMNQGGNSYKKVMNDDIDFDPSLILEVFDYVKELFLFGFNYYADKLPCGVNHSFVVWDKSIEGQDGIMTSDFELCWSKNKHKNLIYRQFWKGFRANEGGDKRIHPTQKPVDLVLWFFDKWADGLNKTVDLFGGSGSTLIACEQTNRICYMMELDPHYCDVIVTRYLNTFDKHDVTVLRDNKEYPWSELNAEEEETKTS